MFSNYLRKTEDSRTKTWMLIGAGLLIAGQLVALVMLADGQVEKAQIRDASQASARAAKAWCIESNRGAALSDCDRASNALASENVVDQLKPSFRTPPLATLVNRY